jgi:hypothetical protein
MKGFVDANQQFVAGLIKLGTVVTVAGAAMWAFGKAMSWMQSAIGIGKRFVDGLQSVHDRVTGVAQAQQGHADALARMKAGQEGYIASLDRLERAQAGVEKAQERVAQADQRAINRKEELRQAEARHTAAVEDAAKRRVAIAEKEAAAIAATKNSYAAQERLGRIQATGSAHQTAVDGASAENQAASNALKAARAALAAETRGLAAAEKALARSGRDAEAQGRLSEEVSRRRAATAKAEADAVQATARAYAAQERLVGAQGRNARYQAAEGKGQTEVGDTGLAARKARTEPREFLTKAGTLYLSESEFAAFEAEFRECLNGVYEKGMEAAMAEVVKGIAE